jgi:asparagine synthase (glutamine-hydrolysing)
MSRQQGASLLQQMLATLQHESFYSSGTWMDESLGVYAGWVARQDSFSDGMPLQNEAGDVTLLFSGEEFSSPELLQQLRSRGHQAGDHPAGHLVHLAEEEGAFPAQLNGRFHGLCLDARRGTATLFNDRYGMHRIYYYESRDAFYFAAEAKAILAVCPEARCLDVKALGEFISCGCVLENNTLFRNVRVLPPASAWVFQKGAPVRKQPYFHPSEWEEQPALDEETYYQSLREIFSRVLPRYFAGPQRIGMSLTGGLDTRMIMAWHKPAPGTLPCYSFGSIYRECQDVRMGRKVAQACGQSHQVIPVEGTYLQNFPGYVERAVYMTDGCVEPSRSPDLYVNEVARNVAPVRMTGNYGGEVLRRIRAFKPVKPFPGLFSADLTPHVQEAQRTYERLIQCHPLSFSVFRQAPWHHYGLQALEQTQLAVRSPFLDNELVRMVFRAPQSTLSSNVVSLRLIEDGNRELLGIRTDRGLAGNSGPWGATLRRGWLEFTFKAEYAYDYGMPQWLTRVDSLLGPLHLERLFLGRHKFYHFRYWYRDSLAGYVQDTLLNSTALSRPYLHAEKVRSLVQRHVTGAGNYTTEIHKLLTLELVHRLLLDAR